MKELVIDRGCNRFAKLLSMCSGKQLLDVATGTGQSAIGARDKGWQVTAFDGRRERMPWDVPGIDWRQATVQDFDYSGYDVVLLCGILYHLTLSDQLELLSHLSAPYLIVNTHFKIDGPQKFKLSPAFRSGDIAGANYSEGPLAELPAALQSAMTNEESFWHTLPSLEWMFWLFGYEVQIVCPWISEDRAWFLMRKR
jgi:hypothetical protein